MDHQLPGTIRQPLHDSLANGRVRCQRLQWRLSQHHGSRLRLLYRSGQRFPRNYGNLWSYNQIPYDLRQRYNFDRNDRYYYGDGYVYRVDPKTMLVEQVVSALLR